jgi:hypothetical protein
MNYQLIWTIFAAGGLYALLGIWKTLEAVRERLNEADLPEKPMSNEMARAWAELVHDRERGLLDADASTATPANSGN